MSPHTTISYSGSNRRGTIAPILKKRQNLSGSTQLIYDELALCGAQPVILSVPSSLVEYSNTKGERRLLFSTCSDKSSAAGRAIAESKARSAIIAAHIDIPVPASQICYSIRDIRQFFEKHRMIVIKPLNGSGGRGVSTDISTADALVQAYEYAKKYSRIIVAQQHITGIDVRLLTIDGKFCSAVIRQPAQVTGDGISTIEELIENANATAPRNDDTFMSILPINVTAAKRFLGEKLQTTPLLEEIVRTAGPANVSLGGSLHEATTLVTPSMVSDAEKISRRLDLGICGVDMMWDQKTNKHYLIEINATPGIDIHDDPYSGTSSGATQRYVQWLLT